MVGITARIAFDGLPSSVSYKGGGRLKRKEKLVSRGIVYPLRLLSPLVEESRLTLKHAIYSAILQTDATATFVFLPSWGGPMSTNPYSKLLDAYPHLCCTLGTISSTAFNYATPQFWVSKEFTLPCQSWSLQIFAV
eukprot:463195-Pelagomonas_calceolata.AAC.1